MRSRIVSLLCFSVAAGLIAFAADVWNSKDPAEWTSQDAQKILNDSPWARQVSVSFDRGQSGYGDGLPGRAGRGGMGGMGGGGGVPGGGMGGPGGAGMPGGGMGGMGRGRGGSQADDREQRQMPQMSVTLRWETAMPVRQAEQKLATSDKPAEAPEKPADQYIVALTNFPPMRGGPRGMDGGEPPQQLDFQQDEPSGNRGRRDPAVVREELMERTQLSRKGKDPIHPSDVKMEQSNGARVTRFFFPRGDNPISLEDKEVTFVTQMGPMKVEKKFRLKDMTYKGKLEI